MRNAPWRTGSIHQASMQAVKRGYLTKCSYNGLSRAPAFAPIAANRIPLKRAGAGASGSLC